MSVPTMLATDLATTDDRPELGIEPPAASAPAQDDHHIDALERLPLSPVSNEEALALAEDAVPVTVRWSKRYLPRLVIADIVSVAIAAICAHVVHIGTLATRLTLSEGHIPFVGLTAAVLVTWLLTLGWSGSRDAELVGFGSDEFKRLMHATFAVFGLLAIGSFVFGGAAAQKLCAGDDAGRTDGTVHRSLRLPTLAAQTARRRRHARRRAGRWQRRHRPRTHPGTAPDAVRRVPRGGCVRHSGVRSDCLIRRASATSMACRSSGICPTWPPSPGPAGPTRLR